MDAQTILISLNSMAVFISLLLLLQHKSDVADTINSYRTDFLFIHQKLETIMGAFEKVQETLAQLTEAVEKERAQVKESLDKLNGTIAKLEEQLANGLSPEQTETLLSELQNVKGSLQTIIPDEAPQA